jgi:hypothetical protein
MRGNMLLRVSRTARIANAREIEAKSILRSAPDSSAVLAASHESTPPRPAPPPLSRCASVTPSYAPAEGLPSPSLSAIEPSLERFASNELETDDIVLGDDSDGTKDDGELAHHDEDVEHDDGIDSDFEEPVGQAELGELSSDADNLSDDELSYRQFLDITYSNDGQRHEPIDDSPCELDLSLASSSVATPATASQHLSKRKRTTSSSTSTPSAAIPPPAATIMAVAAPSDPFALPSTPAPSPANAQRASSSSAAARSSSSAQSSTSTRRNVATWTHDGTTPPPHQPPFTLANTGPAFMSGNSTRSILSDFFPADLINMLVAETDVRISLHNMQCERKAREAGSPVPPPLPKVTVADMYRWLAVIVYMGVCVWPADGDYWRSRMPDGFPLPRIGLMSRNSFLHIKRFVSMCNPTEAQNASDKLAKSRAFLDRVRSICQENYVPHIDLAIDEGQVQCSHRRARISFRGESKKPLSDYIKVFMINDSVDAYLWSFEIDTRSHTTIESVKKLVAPLPRQPYHIAADRFYMGVDNVRRLITEHGVFLWGTLRSDRGADRSLSSPKLKDGESRFSTSEDGLRCTIWRDSDPDGTFFLSPFHIGDEFTTLTRRVDRVGVVEKTAPMVAKDYNQFMGPCDRMNSLRASNRLHLVHKRRWYMGLLYFALDTLLVNAYICRKIAAIADKEHVPDSKEFRLAAIKCFMARANMSEWLASERPPLRRRRGSHSNPVLASHCVSGDNHSPFVWQRVPCVVCRARITHACDQCCVPVHAPAANHSCWSELHSVQWRAVRANRERIEQSQLQYATAIDQHLCAARAHP